MPPPSRPHTRRGTTVDRDAAGICRSASRDLRRESARPRHFHELRQPPHFGARDRTTERRDRVVAAALVIERGGGALVRLDDQPLLLHALNGAIQRSGAQPQLVVGARGDVLNDGVAVSILVRERQQNVKRGRRQGQQSFDLVSGHASKLYPHWIYSQWIYAGRTESGMKWKGS